MDEWAAGHTVRARKGLRERALHVHFDSFGRNEFRV